MTSETVSPITCSWGCETVSLTNAKGNDMKTVNWKQEEERAALMDFDSLLWTITDCMEARDASKGWNPENEGYYQDLASVYSQELNRRKRYSTRSYIRTDY